MTNQKFVPSQEQRKMVTALLSIGIKPVTLSRHVTNPQTGKRIAHSTMLKVFADEIRDARGRS